MSVVTWDMLAKNQTDPETIEEAIDRLISAHNDEETAHIDTGQSLSEHKTDTVIDHPKSSILMDKFNAKEDYHFSDFISLTGWTTAGDVSISSWPGVVLQIVDGETEVSSIYTTIAVLGGYLRKNKNAQIQFTIYADTAANTYALVFGFGAQGLTPGEGFGFKKDGTSFKGYVKVGVTTSYTAEITCDFTLTHVFRAFYNSADGNIEFYIDGVLVATLAVPSGTWDINGIPSVYAKAQGEESGVIKVVSLEFYSDLSQ